MLFKNMLDIKPKPKTRIPPDLKNIKNFPNYYISQEGDVFKLAMNKKSGVEELILVKKYISEGTYSVSLKDDKGKYKNKRVHRLVAEHFLRIPVEYSDLDIEKDLVVLHKNGNKLNNELYNLDWGLRQHLAYHTNIKRLYRLL